MKDDDTRQSSASRRCRGPEGIGQQAAIAIEQGFGSGEGLCTVEEAQFLQNWLAREGRLIPEDDWHLLPLVENQTAEHEVRYRESDHRAVKRTWPGTFGLVPSRINGTWQPRPATPRAYLHRLALQNELFADEIVLEAGMIGSGPSMIIGQPAGGLSLVISQPWLDALDQDAPHPVEQELAPFLQKRGFEPLFGSFYGWLHESNRIVILDAKPDNFIATPEGILPIDLLMTEYEQAA